MSFLNSKSHSLREVEWEVENQVLYNNSILALRELLMLREEGGRGGRITKLSSKIHITRDGLKYYFEVNNTIYHHIKGILKCISYYDNDNC